MLPFKRLFALLSLTVIWPLSSVSPAFGWGKDGHELVGKIADKHLSANARLAVEELLLDNQFTSLSDGRLPNWADAIRGSAVYKTKYPKMNEWHYLDIDVKLNIDTVTVDPMANNGNNVLAALSKFQAILKDPVKPARDRREALFFIAHFVGDLHQPLHAAERENDRGGNLVRVQMDANDRHVKNLHSAWDSEFVKDAVGPMSLADYATRLTNTLTLEKRKKLQEGTVADWILESHKIAREKVYKDKNVEIPATGTPHKLSTEYQIEAAEIVEVQLTKGGVRLAQFLNDTFKE